MIRQILFSAFFLFSTVVSAKTLIINGVPIEIGDIASNGAGCPVGSITATATDDNTQVAILFNAYRAITNTTNTVATTDCNLAIPLSVPKGYSVGILDIDWRGTVFAAPGTFINFHREFFFSGNEGPSTDSNWFGSGFENFMLGDKPVFVYYSACDGTPLIARADTVATVIGENSLFSLRSADVSAELLLTLVAKPCS